MRIKVTYIRSFEVILSTIVLHRENVNFLYLVLSQLDIFA